MYKYVYIKKTVTTQQIVLNSEIAITLKLNASLINYDLQSIQSLKFNSNSNHSTATPLAILLEK